MIRIAVAGPIILNIVVIVTALKVHGVHAKEGTITGVLRA